MKSPHYFMGTRIHGGPGFTADQDSRRTRIHGDQDSWRTERSAPWSLPPRAPACSAAPRHHCDAERGVENMLRPRLETMACEHLLGRAASANLWKHQIGRASCRERV